MFFCVVQASAYLFESRDCRREIKRSGANWQQPPQYLTCIAEEHGWGRMSLIF
jgi:hypothetical protein